MQNWFALSDPAMEETLYEIASLRAFAGLSLREPIPDETTILNFRHLLEANDLAEDILKAINAHLQRKGLLLKKGSIVDATIIAAPSSTKNREGERDPAMHQTKKGNQWYFGMKALIAVDAHSGLVPTVITTAANESDVEQIAGLLHGKEEAVWADSGYRGAQAYVDREELQLGAQVEFQGELWCSGVRGSRGVAVAYRCPPERHHQAARGAPQDGSPQARARQGQRTRQGRAPAPGHQAPVRADEGALPRTGQEHRACGHAVRAVEPVDGTTIVDGHDGSPSDRT